MSNAISDTAKQSRKGRKPINGRAMTAAERKQRQRKATEIKRQEMPSWLKLRHDIWKLLQDPRFMLANAAELINAMESVAAAIAFTAVWTIDDGDDCVRFLATCLGNRELDPSMQPLMTDLLPFKPDQFTEQRLPGFHDQSLLDVIGDMLGESQN